MLTHLPIVCQGLAAKVDDTNPRGHGPYILTEVSFGNKTKVCGQRAEG